MMNVVVYTFMWQISPYNMPWRPRGREGVQFYPSLNLGARCGWVVTATPPVALHTGKRHGMHCTRGWVGGPQGRFGRLPKISPTPGFEPWIVFLEVGWIHSCLLAYVRTKIWGLVSWHKQSHCSTIAVNIRLKRRKKFTPFWFGFVNDLLKAANFNNILDMLKK